MIGIPPPGESPNTLDSPYRYSRISGGESSKEKGGQIVDTASCARRVARFRYALWTLAILIIFVLYVVFFNFGWIFDTNSEKYSGHAENSGSASTKTLVLLGDSLFNRPFQEYNLGAMIRRRLSDYPILAWNEGQDGNTIRDIADRLDSALAHNPDAVILFWDSDCSDINESLLNATQVAQVRAAYTSTLESVVNSTLSYSTVKYMAIAGPGLLGENPNAVLAFHPVRFDGKEDMLDAYRDINKQVAADYNVDYIDLRTSLQNVIPFYWTWYKFWVTKDGEHLNYRGSIILSNMISEALDKSWE